MQLSSPYGLHSDGCEVHVGVGPHRQGVNKVGPVDAALARHAEEPLAVAHVAPAHAEGAEEDTMPAGAAAAAYAERLHDEGRAREDPRDAATAAAAAAPLSGGAS